MNSFDEDAGHRVPARDEKVTHGNKIGGKSAMPDHATFMLHYADVMT